MSAELSTASATPAPVETAMPIEPGPLARPSRRSERR